MNVHVHSASGMKDVKRGGNNTIKQTASSKQQAASSSKHQAASSKQQASSLARN
jgi:hypothetical protein